ncbi:MAG: helix-turn-helix domain-containing protein [Planctomycetota bacterium]
MNARSELLSVNQVATRIQVSPSMVYSLVNSGRLECYRIGRCIRFTEDQLADYLASCESKSLVEASKPRRPIKHLEF